MCTLTYLPLHKREFILTTNRDEDPGRSPAKPPEYRKINGNRVVFPVDGKAGGTWIAASSDRRTACLLNGAFEPHVMGGEYRMSRGLVLLSVFEYPDFNAFSNEYDMKGIEPFTIVSIEPDGAGITEFRWDGEKGYSSVSPADQPAIWSSAQLYSTEAIQKRQHWFNNWLKIHKKYRFKEIMNFHNFGGDGDIANDLRMNRGNRVMTVSTTSVVNLIDKVEVHYIDHLSGDASTRILDVVKVVK